MVLRMERWGGCLGSPADRAGDAAVDLLCQSRACGYTAFRKRVDDRVQGYVRNGEAETVHSDL